MSYSIDLIEKDIPEHQHKNYEISTYIKGTGVIHFDNEEFYMSPGKIIIVPPGILHRSTRTKNSKRIYICGEFGQIFNFDYPVMVLDNSQGEGSFLAQMIYNNRFGNPEYVASLTNAFAHFLMQSLRLDDEIGLKIQEIIEEITNNFYNSDISLNSLLNQSGYAEDYIRAHFKKFTGKTPTEFLTSVRIAHACYLIDIYKNTRSLNEIAEKCGYVDYVYFSRRFKQIKGISPREYMKNIV